MTATTVPPSMPSAADLRRAARRHRGRPAGATSPTSSASSTSTAAATRPAGVDEVGRWTGRVPGRPRRHRRDRGPTRPAASATRSWPRSTAAPARHALLLIGHMDTVFDPGTAAARPFRDRGRHRPRPRRDRHEVRPAGGPLRAQGAHRRARAACPSSASCSSPTRTRRSARRPRRRTSASSPPTRTSPSSSSAPAPTATSCRRARGSSTCGSTVHGRAAHAGVEPEKGRSAILEAARIVARPARAQRPLARRDRQRRRDRGRHATQRRRRALLARGRRPRGDRARRSRPPRPRSAGSPRRPWSPTRPSSSSRWPAGGRWRSSSAPGGSSSTRRAVAAALGFDVADAATGGAVGRQHDVGHGRPEPRRPRADRRQRPLAGRVPRGRLDRAADDAARRPARWRSRRDPEVLAWRDERAARRVTRSGGGSRRAARGRPSPATAGRSSSATRAGSPARPTPGPTAGRATPATSAAQARAILGDHRARPRRGRVRLADVVRTRMFVTDISRCDAR